MPATPFALGSVSTGTLRTQDLLPAFAKALKGLNTSIHDFVMAVPERSTTRRERCDALMHYLQEECPPFVTFGPNPDTPCAECQGVKGDRAGICRTCNGSGDGADFGFWPDWDAINDQCPNEYGASYLAECIVEIHGSEQVTVLTLDRRIIWSTA